MELDTETAWRKVLAFGKRKVPYRKLKTILAPYPDVLAAAKAIQYDKIGYFTDEEIATTKKIFEKLYKRILWQ